MSQYERAALLSNDGATGGQQSASPTSSAGATSRRQHSHHYASAADDDNDFAGDRALNSTVHQQYRQQQHHYMQQHQQHQHHHGSAHHQHQLAATNNVHSSTMAMTFSSEEEEDDNGNEDIHQNNQPTASSATAAATGHRSVAAVVAAAAEWSSGSYTSSSNSHSSASSRYENGDSQEDEEDDDNDEDDGNAHPRHRNNNHNNNNDSDTDSYVPDWEPFVQPDGSLFYVEYDCHPIAQQPQQQTQTAAAAKPSSSSSSLLNRSATRRSSNTNLSGTSSGSGAATGKRAPLTSKLSTLMQRNLRLGLGAVVSRPSNHNATTAGKEGGSATAGTAAAAANASSSSTGHNAQGAATTSTTNTTSTTSVKFSEIPEGEVKQLRCILDPSQRHKFGRRASVAEALLGISVSPFQDGHRLMIAGYMPALPAVAALNSSNSSGVDVAAVVSSPSVGLTGQQERRYAKVGDWLKAIDGREVSSANLDAVLLAYTVQTEVLVTLQRMSGEAPPSSMAAVSSASNADTAATSSRNAGATGGSVSSAASAAQLSLNRVCSWAEMASNAQQVMRAEVLIDEDSVFVDSAADNQHHHHHQHPHSSGMVLSVMYLTLKDLAETSSASLDGQDDVLFCYPEREQNPLYATRGSFLTLNSLLLDEMCMSSSSSGGVGSSYDSQSNGFGIGAQLTSIDVPLHGRYHVVYWAVDSPADRRAGAMAMGGGSDVLLVALAAAHSTREAARARAAELAQCMQFVHQKQTLALTNPANHARWSHVCRMVGLLVRYAPHAEQVQRRFEAQLAESEWLPLPKDAQMRIDDALGEMEAMDYREWNGRPLQSHREFYVIGSAVWWSGWLLGTHLPPSDLLDVERFLRVHGVLRLLSVRTVREMLVWQEVYPASVERGLVQQNYAYGIPQGRWFLAIVARGQMLLAVLLEARHDSDLLVPHITPSPFYIEEIQDTFELLKAGGIETIAETWMRCNKRPQVLVATAGNASPGNGGVMASGLITAADGPSAAGTSAASLIGQPQQQQQPPIVAKKAEIISILKRRNNSTENVMGGPTGTVDETGNNGKLLSLPASSSHGQANPEQQQQMQLRGSASVNSQTFSEDSNHDDSDSDWDGFPDSQRSSSGYDLSEGPGTEHLLRDVSDVLPGKITAGPANVLYHYVHIDCGQGVFVAAPGRPPADPIMQAFRRACLSIHAVLQATVRIRYAQAQAPTQPAAQRALVAIKEHGILLSLPNNGHENGGTTTDFWVIGRLFQSPPKELYVCHRADVPQNMVEIAFRLSMSMAG